MVLDSIEHVPEHQKVVETLGAQWGIWGAFFIAVVCLIALPAKRSLLPVEWEILGVSGALGLGLAGYEIWRRRNRTVLVKDGEGIAVFRKGRLDLTVAPGEIKQVKAGLPLMLKVGAGLGMCAAIFTAIGMMGLLRDKKGIADNLIILFMGFTCWASLIAAAWTRFSCAHLRVPIKGGRLLVEETVLVPSSRLKELFP